MSLNKAEQRQTGEDLRAYLAASGLQRAELADWLRLDSDELDAVLERTGGEASPVRAWLVRDALDQVVRESGATAPGWRILTDAARIRALGWFPLKEVPPRTV